METVEELKKQLKEQVTKIENQAKRIAELESIIAHLKKDSTNSSYPPSSDIVKGNKDKKDEKTQQADNKKDEKSQSEDGTVDEKPETEGGKKAGKPKKEDGKNTRGGQFGHKKQERKLFPPEQVDTVIEAKLTNCPNCGEALNAADDEIKVTQQIGVVAKPFTVTEYHQQTGYCPHCNTYHAAPLPQEAASGLFSITLIAFLAYLKGRCHTSYSALQDFFRDVLQLESCKFAVKRSMACLS
ncbi:hypothetical protein FACS1894200_09650 [Spirochaetia bacterium]|nr:hypothetical protein FACS1894200_09650 [Spirochaetia bacterium]